jgi:hypothetical protein
VNGIRVSWRQKPTPQCRTATRSPRREAEPREAIAPRSRGRGPSEAIGPRSVTHRPRREAEPREAIAPRSAPQRAVGRPDTLPDGSGCRLGCDRSWRGSRGTCRSDNSRMPRPASPRAVDALGARRQFGLEEAFRRLPGPEGLARIVARGRPSAIRDPTESCTQRLLRVPSRRPRLTGWRFSTPLPGERVRA